VAWRVTGFLGGLVNSTVTVTELAARARETGGRLADVIYRGVLLSTAAMAVRNAVLPAILAAGVLADSALPLVLMLLASLVLAWQARTGAPAAEGAPAVRLASPFSLQAALKFGLIFLLLQTAGTLAQRALGEVGFYAVSLIAGLGSSASGVAAAALAAHGTITAQVAGVGVVLNSLASTAIKLPLVARISGDRGLTLRVALALGLIMVLGLGATFVPVSAVRSVAAGG
jgi:uncharacterized membrane protein (DUF4010 family)